MQDNMDNGHAPDQYDNALISEIEDRMGVLDTKRELLMEQVAAIDFDLKRYEKAIKALEGMPKEPPKVKPNTAAQKRTKDQRATALKTLARSEMWPGLREQIIAHAREHEEFTQTQFRKVYDIPSPKASLAFELLRQEKVLRLARVDGNFKYYRLTEAHINAE